MKQIKKKEKKKTERYK